MQPIATQHTLISNYRIAYNTFGHSNGPPIILLHGTPSSSLIWRNLIPQLTATYRVFTYDLLGYGESERPANTDTSISAQVPILASLLAFWHLDRAILCAHDIGGAIAQRFAIFHPEKVADLVLLDSVSFDSYPSPRTRAQMATGLDTLSRAPDDEHRASVEAWLRSAVHDPARLEASGALAAYADYISGPVGQASFYAHQVVHYDPKHTMEIADRMGEIGRGRRVLLVWGREDMWQVLSWAERLRDAIVGAKLCVVEGAGHFCLEDQAERIASILVRFLVGEEVV